MNIGRKVFPQFNIETINQSFLKSDKQEQIKTIYGYRIVRLRNYDIEGSLLVEVKK